MAPLAPFLLPSELFQPVLRGSIPSKAQVFEGLSMSTYTLGMRGEIFHVLEVEARKTLILSPEGTQKENWGA